MRVRQPVAAGSFYERTEEDLKEQIEECFLHPLGPGSLPKIGIHEERRVLGLISPHAGYMYSGHVAAHGYYQLALDPPPKRVIIMGPNHTGFGPAVAISSDSAWQTPLGKVNIDVEISQKILSMDLAEIGDSAHRMEHSIEVQLPFLQYLYGSNFTFVPICILNQRLEICEELGKELAQIIRETEDCMLVASSDFTHYEPHANAETKDTKAIEAIIQMNSELLDRIIDDEGISMCGPGPIIALISAGKRLSCSAKFLSYHTSGEITDDYSAVVGYASFTIIKGERNNAY